MNNRNERRRFLIAQAAAQRALLTHNLRRWGRPLSMVGHGFTSSLQLVKFHPVWMAGGIVTFAALRSRLTRKWILNGLVVWRIIRELRNSGYARPGDGHRF